MTWENVTMNNIYEHNQQKHIYETDDLKLRMQQKEIKAKFILTKVTIIYKIKTVTVIFFHTSLWEKTQAILYFWLKWLKFTLDSVVKRLS